MLTAYFMKTKFFNSLSVVLPLLLFTAMLCGLLAVRFMFNMTLPLWGAWAFVIAWGVMAFDCLLRAELFKQIGGFAVTLIAVVILVGALVPQQKAAQYPKVTSEQMVRNMEYAWSAVYQGNLFEKYCLKQQLIDYGHSLGRIDPFRHGKIILYAVMGMFLGIVYLFPLNPVLSFHLNFMYARRFGILFLGGALFAAHVELLQVLSPSRMVTFSSFADSAGGLLVGLLAFIPLHLFYIWLAHFRLKGNVRFNVIGVGVDAVCMADCLQKFQEIIEGHSPMQKSEDSGQTSDDLISDLRSPTSGGHRPVMTSALGVAGIVEARRNQKLQRILNESVLNTPDGMPLVWLGKLFGYRNIERVYGPDLLRDVCAYSAPKGWKHFFYGAAPGIVDRLKVELERKNPGIQIVGTVCPPFRPLTPKEEDELITQVAETKPDIFWIGISTPKQLYFMDRMRDKLDCKILCPVGYAFDVNAGVEEDAPDWAKYSGFQWLHRAIKQPRLWKRYLPDNPRFVFEVLLQILRVKRYPMFIHEIVMAPYMDAEGYPRFPAGVVSLSAMTLEKARDRVLGWVKDGQRHYVNICTADTMVQCFDRPDMAHIVMQSGMATTDGMPLVWLAHHYGFKDAARVYGPDLMLELCRATSVGSSRPRMSENKDASVFAYPSQDETGSLDLENISQSDLEISHFFYGATDEVLEQLKNNLLNKFPNLKIAGLYSPPFRPLTPAEKDDVTDMINQSGADIVWCGLGTPKQDYWVSEFRPRLKCAAILAVGAAFNFHAGHVRQAPRWMMKNGLEWLFRLYVEPRRLWRRYIIGNPRFILLTWRQFLSRARSNK